MEVGNNYDPPVDCCYSSGNLERAKECKKLCKKVGVLDFEGQSKVKVKVKVKFEDITIVSGSKVEVLLAEEKFGQQSLL